MTTGPYDPPFHSRMPWVGIIGVSLLLAILINVARVTTPWVLLAPCLLWAFKFVRHEAVRDLHLRQKGYFGGWRVRDHWIYEESQGSSCVALVLPVACTEPGHYELFIPDDALWRATVPAWARDRRKEIAARIAERWRAKDFHLPEDLRSP